MCVKLVSVLWGFTREIFCVCGDHGGSLFPKRLGKERGKLEVRLVGGMIHKEPTDEAVFCIVRTE
jgi:hypothetical protein